jgi:hypothetical protein
MLRALLSRLSYRFKALTILSFFYPIKGPVFCVSVQKIGFIMYLITVFYVITFFENCYRIHFSRFICIGFLQELENLVLLSL